MKSYQHLSIIAAISCFAWLLSACTEQNEAIADADGEAVPLEINLKGCDTRAVITGNTLPDESILGIFAVNDDNKVGYNNIHSVYTQNQWTLSETVYLTESDKRIYAYYPYSEEANLNSVSINTQEQIDHLYGYAVNENNQMTTVNATNPKANILLKHALSRITLHIKKAESNKKEGAVYNVALAGVPLSATLDISNGSIKTADNGDLVIKSVIKLTTEGENIDILVPPTKAENIMLSIDINEKYHSVQMPVGVWKSGQQYTYTVEVSDNSLQIGEASITPWDDNLQEGIEVGDNNYVE